MISIDRLIICETRIEVKSVIVPNTSGLKGIEIAAAAGIAGGQADKAPEAIAQVTPEQREEMHQFLKQMPASVHPVDNGIIFDIIVKLTSGTDSSVVQISQYHTNIVYIEKNGQVLLDNTALQAKGDYGSDARMSGCELLVVINSGSGNQGITVSAPVIEYTKDRLVHYYPKFGFISEGVSQPTHGNVIWHQMRLQF